MKSFKRRLLILSLLLIGSSLPGFGQSTQSTILGTVTDPNGRAVPGARIEVVNIGTSFSRTVTTDSTGSYRVPDLDPGTYRVVAVQPGFDRWVGEGLTLEADQIKRVDARLNLGSVNTTVTVQARGTNLDTEAATLANPHLALEFSELPMSIYGRSSFNVTFVTAGVQSTSGQVIVNGAPDSANSFTVDGVAHDDAVSSRQSPNNFDLDVDGMQEIKVQTANNSAEYPQVGQFITVSKSGGNQVHGSLLWEDFNSYFSTRDFFDYTSQKPAFTNNNEFGVTFGGPVYIPKLYNGRDKTFFFFSYGGQRYRIGARGYLNVPTTAMRNGDFSSIASAVTIRDPLTGNPNDPSTWQPFSGNIIPTSRINPVAQAFENLLYPQPNRPGSGTFGVAGNYTSDPGGAFNNDVYSARIDQKISDRNTIFVRVGLTKTDRIIIPATSSMGAMAARSTKIPGGR